MQSGRGRLAIRGGSWSIAGYVATQVLRTVATMVLARLFLGPETFGVVGLVGVFLAGLAMFSELGILANVVQHPRGDDPQFLNTAFSIQAVRGMTIWVIAALAAYPLAVFYKQPQLLPLLLVAGCSETIRGLTSTAAWTLTRHINLRGITLLTIAAEVVGAALGIVWALISPSAWALVVRTIASAAVSAIGSHFIAKPRVKFSWDPAAAKDILHFGGWISLATATYFLSGQGERLILGKFVTAAELGCFSLAVMVSSMPAGGISQLVNQIFLPIISKSVRDSNEAGAKDFLRARRMFFGLAVFASLGFLICAKPFVALLLPAKYAMTGWMLQALGVRVGMDVFAAPASTLILAYGKSKYSAMASTLRLVLMVGGIAVSFMYFGIHQAVLSLLVAQAISYFPMMFGLMRLLPDIAKEEFRWYMLFLGVLVVGAAVCWRAV
ncbi:MAG: oligosaccharide flippase family protein [Paludibaculum sp.]